MPDEYRQELLRRLAAQQPSPSIPTPTANDKILAYISLLLPKTVLSDQVRTALTNEIDAGVSMHRAQQIVAFLRARQTNRFTFHVVTPDAKGADQ